MSNSSSQLDTEKTKNTPYVPVNYVVNQNGVFKKDNDDMIPVCDQLYIAALARSDNGDDWGKLLMWKDKDGQSHQWSMPNAMLAGDGAEYRRVLLSQGLGIHAGKKAQNALHDYIMSANPPDRATSTSKPGWHKGRYVMPDGSVIGQGEDTVLLQVSGVLPRLEKQGDLKSWQENVAKYAEGNSRLIFALSSTLAGILLSYSNESSGGFHLSGGSSTGKTTALKMAASVWGAALRSWRTTDNAAESWGRFSNDGFLAIDELGQVDSKSAEQMSYMFGNGQGKGRSNREGIARETLDFKIVFLSTGEIGLADKLSEDKKKARAGQGVRMVEIPADAGKGMGAFEHLHHFRTANEFAVYLGQAIETNKGVAVHAFINALVKYNKEKTAEVISEKILEWIEQNVPVSADGQVKRVARRFALVSVAGELAIHCGVFPWEKGSARAAAITCFQNWLYARGGVGSHEVQEGIKEIIQFIERHGNSRFQRVGNSFEEEVIHNRVGFKKHEGESWMYFITPKTLKSEVLYGSQNTGAIIKAAVAEGLIIPDGEGNASQPRDLPGLKKTRVLCIVPALHKKQDLPESI